MNQALTEDSLEPSTQPRHWLARLDLEFARSGAATRLVHSEHRGPLRVQRLFYPEADGKAHCYLLHPPGGVVLGDELAINVRQLSGATLLTTPSAGRFYAVGAHPEPQRQSVHLEVRGGVLEWLPQETILFSGANARLETDIRLSGDAALVFWDVLVLGRPACEERFISGRVQQTLRLRRDNQLLLEERLNFEAGDRFTQSMIGLAGFSTLGVMLATATPPRELLDSWLLSPVQGKTASGPDCPFVVTQRDSLLIARYRGDDAFECREGFATLWLMLQEHLSGERPAVPRIWHT